MGTTTIAITRCSTGKTPIHSTKAAPAVDVLIYAAGGGLGHLTRAVAIVRAIKKLSPLNPTILTTSDFSNLFESDSIRIIRVNLVGEAKADKKKILKTLRKFSPKVFVVDALPLGLFGELPEYFNDRITIPTVLISRLLRKDYRIKFGVDALVRFYYDLVIRAENLPEDFLFHKKAIETPPILSCENSEILSRAEARKLLAVPRGKSLILAVSTLGAEDADVFFGTVLKVLAKAGNPKAVLKFASPFGDPDPSSAHTSFFPLMKLMRGADLIVGNGGYHLVHETRALNIPHAVLPLTKLYDDQDERVNIYASKTLIPFRSPKELERIFTNFLSSKSKPKKVDFENGAVRAAKSIVKLF